MSNLVAVDGIPAARLAEICRAELEGRLVVLPCKIGSTIYFPYAFRELDGSTKAGIEEYYLSGYIKENDREFYTACNNMCSVDIVASELCLTPAEAQKALTTQIIEAEQEASHEA